MRSEYIIYPLTIASVVGVYLAMLWFEVPTTFSTYLCIFLAAASIVTFERLYPYREEWAPDKLEVANDLTFMVIVQVLLPKFLTYLLVVGLLNWLTLNGLTIESYWPHQAPLLVQACIMLLISDFLRYWLHRACHESRILWKLHAVHHSPHKLYFVNVGRFHPLEKSAQYFLDSLPFILLGVSAEVLGLYLVFYAANGFFQHCNIKLSLGWLNYIVSGPELHRWHHSKVVKESDHNFGNNLIIWDLAFGSYYLPDGKEVKQLGTLNRDYPQGFVSQMATPFIKGIEYQSHDKKRTKDSL